MVSFHDRRIHTGMDEPLQKFITFVPTTLNDGTPVEPEVILEFEEKLFLLADGFTEKGTVRGAYRMADGRRQIDHSLEYWIWIKEDRKDELREVVAELGGKLGQESMYLERSFANLDFVPPTEQTEE